MSTTENAAAPTQDLVQFEAPIGPKAKAIADRIEAERTALAKAGAQELELRGKRQAALVSGTDTEINRIESDIEACLSVQSRIRERVDLLGAEVSKANEAHRGVELDAVTANAHRAREAGEKLIREYAIQAAKVAETLAKLKATDVEIDAANLKLQRANRPLVESSNRIRCRPGSEVSRVVRQKVSIDHPQHPYYGRNYVRNAHDGILTDTVTGARIEPMVEADVTVVEKIPASFPYPSSVPTRGAMVRLYYQAWSKGSRLAATRSHPRAACSFGSSAAQRGRRRRRHRSACCLHRHCDDVVNFLLIERPLPNMLDGSIARNQYRGRRSDDACLNS
jgi:hypothetical protein